MMFRRLEAGEDQMDSAARSGVTYINVSWNLDKRSISRMSLLPAKFRNISEEHWRREVSLDISLLEWFDFARKDMLKGEGHVVL